MNPIRILVSGATAALLLVIGLAPTATAQSRRESFTWPSHPRNLQILPKNIRPEQLRMTMTGFTKALGVRCVFCHVGTEGRPLSTYDFASDRKAHKGVARGMMRMTRQINRDLDAIRRDEERAHAANRNRHPTGDDRDDANARTEEEEHEEHGAARNDRRGGHEDEDKVDVQCATCHRGKSTPTLTSTGAAEDDADRNHDDTDRRSR